ncbi:glycoside hydrolase 15-related protein [alpha proteobacterium BAL199]|nr:glycoside hydrolase 15-related protein [alpha proteobacterium BAL199]
MSTLDLGLIGNCCFGALVDPYARIVWCCLPRFDGEPVFDALLRGDQDEAVAAGGSFAIELGGAVKAEQRYVPNTPVLVTRITADDGAAIEITDFAPRFKRHDRMFRPTTIVRHVRPVAGLPRIRIRISPSFGWGSAEPQVTRGSNHIRWVGPSQTVRLTTDAVPSYILDQTWFLLDAPVSMLLGADESLTDSIPETARVFFDDTVRYWRDWTRSLNIPFEWQDEVIRSAITLKLCTFEETGAVIAAMTTSIPEAPNSQRNWDYRYCWLRDAYFVVHTLNRLSATRTLEHYLRYIQNIVAKTAEGAVLQPLYSITLDDRIEERIVDTLPGYRGMGPVRVGNAAYLQVQHDVFGSVILAVAQSFFDTRLTRMGDEALYRQLARLGRVAVERFDVPDAGIWELRTRASVHTFSALMCWAAADRLARIATVLGLDDEAADWRAHAETMHARICDEAWSDELGGFSATFGGQDLDASLLLIHELGFLKGDDPRYVGTVEAIEKGLKRGNHVFRYDAPDDFGTPEVAFTVCTFWFIEALAAIGRKDEARQMFEEILACRNSLGLLSEDVDPVTGELWGNFPQTYSMVGLIKCAMRLSRPWEDVV